jgi:hypothetical protein
VNTVGYLFILLGAFLFSEVTRGRVGKVTEDLGAFITGLLTGNMEKVNDVIHAKGDATDVPVITPNMLTDLSTTGGLPNSSLVAEVEKLGTGKPYIYGSAGPEGYDCSGLVWRAMRNLGIYDGPRFTTDTFPAVARGLGMTRPATPANGDVVVWPGSGPHGHMGVVVRPDVMFSARSSRANPQIGESSISGHGGSPIYFRLPGSLIPNPGGRPPSDRGM